MHIDRPAEGMKNRVNMGLINSLTVLLQLHLENIETDIVLRRFYEIAKAIKNETASPFRRKIVPQKNDTARTRMWIESIHRFPVVAAIRTEVCNGQSELQSRR